MQAMLITQAELEALSGLSPLAYVIYLNLRARMDLETRIVGKKSYLSHQALIEATCQEVPKGKGYQRIYYKIHEIRTALDALVRVGLLVKVQEGLVFILAKSKGAFSRQKQTAQEFNKLDAAENAIKLGTYAHSTQPASAERLTHQGSVYKSNACPVPHPEPAPVSKEAGEVLAWIEAEGVKANTKTKHDDAIRLFKAGKATVQAAARVAHGVRLREGSTAPVNFGLVLKCLPKGAFCPTPKATTPSEPRQRPATIVPNFTAEDQAKGMAFLQRVARKKEARNHA